MTAIDYAVVQLANEEVNNKLLTQLLQQSDNDSL